MSRRNCFSGLAALILATGMTGCGNNPSFTPPKNYINVKLKQTPTPEDLTNKKNAINVKVDINGEEYTITFTDKDDPALRPYANQNYQIMHMLSMERGQEFSIPAIGPYEGYGLNHESKTGLVLIDTLRYPSR